MNQRLSDLASIAEIIGAGGVILSLIFVGIQLGEGNRETRLATLQAATDSEMTLQGEFLRYADIWQKINLSLPLEEDEVRRGIVLYQMTMTEFANRHHQFEAGYFDDAWWESRQLAMTRVLKRAFFETWRTSVGASLHSPIFLKIVDDLEASP